MAYFGINMSKAVPCIEKKCGFRAALRYCVLSTDNTIIKYDAASLFSSTVPLFLL
jgi:hypothetical protein